jgi:hypothetical protein
MHKIFLWENLKESDNFGGLGAEGKLKLKLILKNRLEGCEQD